MPHWQSDTRPRPATASGPGAGCGSGSARSAASNAAARCVVRHAVPQLDEFGVVSGETIGGGGDDVAQWQCTWFRCGTGGRASMV